MAGWWFGTFEFYFFHIDSNNFHTIHGDFHPIFPSEPSKAGAPETANGATSVTNGAPRRGVKFTSEPAAALKLIDTEKWLGPTHWLITG